MRHSFMLPILCLVIGCGSSMPDVRPTRPNQLRANQAPELPMLLEFKPGDRIPLDIAIDGALMVVEPGEAPPVVVVKKRFFVLIDDNEPPRISLDGRTLGQVRGSLGVGLGVTEKEGVRASVRMSTKEAQ